jgi:hypothetical protein
MPNCDFYGTPEDHEELLSWLFSEATCHVFESYSAFEQPLSRFESPQDVLQQFDRRYTNGEKWSVVYLQLYVIGAGPQFTPQRVKLDPKDCNGASFRYAAEGWGLVQLYLTSAKADGLENSHTNHNSRKRAEAWAPTYRDLADHPSAWDFDRITSFSSRLNRQIRKMGVGNVASRPVLPGAMKVWQSGLSLWPYKPGQDTMKLM